MSRPGFCEWIRDVYYELGITGGANIIMFLLGIAALCCILWVAKCLLN